MTLSEQTGFNAGIAHAVTMAEIAVLRITARPDADGIRQKAAAAALEGLADGLRALLPDGTDPIKSGQSATVADPKGTHETRIPVGVQAEPGIPVTETPRPAVSDQRHAAIVAGYTGDPCPRCHAFKLRRSGTCLVCDGCASTTGCS